MACLSMAKRYKSLTWYPSIKSDHQLLRIWCHSVEIHIYTEEFYIAVGQWRERFAVVKNILLMLICCIVLV